MILTCKIFSVVQTAARSGIGSSSSARSVLPPMTPTSSRYWDRDRDGGTSRNSVSNSSALNSSSLKHNSDDGYKSASSSRDEKSEGGFTKNSSALWKCTSFIFLSYYRYIFTLNERELHSRVPWLAYIRYSANQFYLLTNGPTKKNVH